MAVLTAQGISAVAIELLRRTLVLPATVTRVPSEDFRGSNGDTITVRVPQPSTARTQASAGATITYDDVSEVPVDVTLSHLYHAKLVSDQETQYSLENFARQITMPQVAAVATRAENQITTVMNALASQNAFAAVAAAADTKSVLQEMREAMSTGLVPHDNRYLACSPSIITRILGVDEFVKVDESGSDGALRRAVIGRIYGFEVFECAGLTAGTAVGYHRSGFVWANAVPVAPRGAAESASVVDSGIGLRQIFQYVPDKLSDASVISTFAGAAAVAEDDPATVFTRSYKITTTP
jgi:hypothetical protein